MPDSDIVRPLLPGEFMKNEDGSRSTEFLRTITHPLINGGQPTNIPSIYKINDRIFMAPDEETAITLARKSGLTYPSFKSIDEAVNWAKDRSRAGGVFSGPLVPMREELRSRIENNPPPRSR